MARAAADDLEVPLISALVRMARRPALNMRQFTVASQLSPTSARVLRDRLERFGLIEARAVRQQGATEIYEIRLTPLGRKVARHALAIDALLQDAHPADKASPNDDA